MKRDFQENQAQGGAAARFGVWEEREEKNTKAQTNRTKHKLQTCNTGIQAHWYYKEAAWIWSSPPYFQINAQIRIFLPLWTWTYSH